MGQLEIPNGSVRDFQMGQLEISELKKTKAFFHTSNMYNQKIEKFLLLLWVYAIYAIDESSDRIVQDNNVP